MLAEAVSARSRLLKFPALFDARPNTSGVSRRRLFHAFCSAARR
jgi:hypothetical protein